MCSGSRILLLFPTCPLWVCGLVALYARYRRPTARYSILLFPRLALAVVNLTHRIPDGPEPAVAAAALLLTVLGACDGGQVAEPEASLEIVPDSVTLTLVRVSQVAAALERFGEGQRAAPGLSLLEPVGVRVLDAGGSPVSGTAVRFEPRKVDSDSAGVAAVEWTRSSQFGRIPVSVIPSRNE